MHVTGRIQFRVHKYEPFENAYIFHIFRPFEKISILSFTHMLECFFYGQISSLGFLFSNLSQFNYIAALFAVEVINEFL